MMNKLLPLLLFGLMLQMQSFAQLTIQATVDHIIDGDTFVIKNKRESQRLMNVKVRIKCIDAPEIKQLFINSDNKKKEIGIEAREHLKQILSDSSLITLKCNDERDKYGRFICNVFDKNQNSINLQMVKEGYAYAIPSKCLSGIEGMIYLGYQYFAIFSQSGLWQYGVWDEPWKWRGG